MVKRKLNEEEKLEGIGIVNDDEMVDEDEFEVEEADEEQVVGFAADEENEVDDAELIAEYEKCRGDSKPEEN